GACQRVVVFVPELTGNSLKPWAIRVLMSVFSNVPQIDLCATHALATMAVDSSTSGAPGLLSGFPTPRSMLRSCGPTSTPAIPGSLRISLTFLIASRDSTITSARRLPFGCPGHHRSDCRKYSWSESPQYRGASPGQQPRTPTGGAMKYP